MRIIKRLTLLSLATALLSCQHTQDKESAASAAVSVPSGMALIKAHQVPEGKVGIPYKKYQLDNGLVVILHHDDSDPLVHIDVTYHVGSAREELGKSGFAHFFEHMMFQGSENVADEQHFKLITEAGGEMNGTTNSDRTNYYQTVPANQLEKVLWLEADRMGFLLDAVTQEKFEVQRETVKNERAQRIDNQPYGLRSERVAEALYPNGHPYSWPVIGYIDDLNRVSVDDLKAFFQRWYGPNNAVLTIGGDIDEQQTLAWVKRYFGNIPAGPEVAAAPKTTVTLPQDRYLTLEDDVHLPLLQMTMPTVHVRHADEAPLDVLADILGGGKTSILYKNLVRNGWAVHAGVGHPCRELACQFEFVALPNPQRLQSLTQLQQVVLDSLSEFEQRGVNDDDLLRTKASIRSGSVYGLQSVAGKVSTLASNQVFNGEPDQVKSDIERYESVTKDDVMRVFQTYIKGKPAVFLSIVPNGQTAMQAAQPNFDIPARDIPVTTGKTTLAWRKPVDNFDRSLVPKAGSNKAVTVPAFVKTRLTNQIPMMLHSSAETPTVTLALSLEGGPLLDPLDKAGLAALTAGMMSESTQHYSNEAMANELAKLGSSIQFSAGGRFTSIYVSSLKDNLPATLALLEEKLLHPAFAEADFERLKALTLQSLQQSAKKPEVRSRNQISTLLYGVDNRISLPDSGTLATVQNIALEDVKRFYQRYFNGAKASLVVVGDVSEQQLLPQLEFLAKWPTNDYPIPAYKPFPEHAYKTVYVVNDPAAAQSIVTFVKPALPYDAEGQQFRTKLVNFPFGGAFNSRINLNLREDKGYTYGARSQFVGGKTLGRFEVGGAMNKQHTIAALNEIVTELQRYQQQGITDEELQFMRNAYTQGDALNYETPGSKTRFLRHLSMYNLDVGFPERQNQIISTITKDELNALAAAHFDPDSMMLVLVADVSALGETLEQWAEQQGRRVVYLNK